MQRCIYNKSMNKKQFRNICLGLLPLLLCGCMSQLYQVTGGDRAAGTVTLSCDVTFWEGCAAAKTAEMQNDARKTCARWGYEDAVPFGGHTIDQDGGFGWGRVDVTYQCIGHLENSENKQE